MYISKSAIETRWRVIAARGYCCAAHRAFYILTKLLSNQRSTRDRFVFVTEIFAAENCWERVSSQWRIIQHQERSLDKCQERQLISAPTDLLTNGPFFRSALIYDCPNSMMETNLKTHKTIWHRLCKTDKFHFIKIWHFAYNFVVGAQNPTETSTWCSVTCLKKVRKMKLFLKKIESRYKRLPQLQFF